MNLTDLTQLQQKKAEQLFAGAVLINPGLALERCAWLKPEDILDQRVSRFWRNMTGSLKGDPIASAMEATALTDITSWSTEVMSSFDVEAYAREIHRRAYLASSDPLLAEIMRARQMNDVEAMRQAIGSLYAAAPASRQAIPTASEIGVEFLAALDTNNLSTRTWVPGLDDAIGGLETGINYVLAARPSMGKSTLAFQIARNVAHNRNKVIYFSLEMSRVQLWAKATCGRLGLSWRDVREKRVSPEMMERVRQTSSDLTEEYEDFLMIDDRVHHTSESIWQIVAAEKPALVVVDVMARLKDRNDNEVKRLGNIAYLLREMGKENHCATLVLHHVNRESEKQEHRTPTLANLRDSGEIEQAADVVVLLHSDDYYDPAKGGQRYLKTDAIVAKNRDGARNILVRLAYDTKEQWFIAAKDANL